MESITLSIMNHNPQTGVLLRRLLDEFEAVNRVHVELQMLAWNTGRQELTHNALYQQGADVSEIGTTWVADLVAMNALRPFNRMELNRLGKVDEFVSASWQAARLGEDDRLWASPWLVETYVIHYRTDLLAQAGLEAGAAFKSLSSLDQTAGTLGASGVEIPLQLPLHHDRFGTLHSLAAWLWGYGGEFCTPDGRQVLFDRPEALAAIRDYFSLLRHLSPSARLALAGSDGGTLFRAGKSAIAFGTLSLTQPAEQITPLVRENWDTAPFPGPHFVGGSNLVIWQHSRRDRLALELVRFLNSPEVVAQCAQTMSALPSRLSVLESPEFSADRMLAGMTRSALNGRPYPSIRLWGLIEDRLVDALVNLGAQALSNPEIDLEAVVAQVFQPLARRVNTMLAS